MNNKFIVTVAAVAVVAVSGGFTFARNSAAQCETQNYYTAHMWACEHAWRLGLAKTAKPKHVARIRREEPVRNYVPGYAYAQPYFSQSGERVTKSRDFQHGDDGGHTQDPQIYMQTTEDMAPTNARGGLFRR